jgi:putative SOS response-associated peptidase YedK
MCGRYTVIELHALPDLLGALVRFDEVFEQGPPDSRYNVAPSQFVPIVLGEQGDGDGQPVAVLRWAQWGFQPAWFKPSAKQPPPINARAESLLERPMFRGAVAQGRCLIPANGFYEWKAQAGRGKQPMYIRLKDSALFVFAGLYTSTRDGEGAERLSCAIVTCGPNELMAEIHRRMPVLMPGADARTWMDRSITDPQAVMPLLRPYPAAEMEVYPVGPAVSSARNDGPQLLMPLS